MEVKLCRLFVLVVVLLLNEAAAFISPCIRYSIAALRISKDISKEDLLKMVKVASLRKPKVVVPAKNDVIEKRGFGAAMINKVGPEASSGDQAGDAESRSRKKERYRALLERAKKEPALVKVVGTGVDASIPKQTMTSGSSRGR